jgi:hypothetical protein
VCWRLVPPCLAVNVAVNGRVGRLHGVLMVLNGQPCWSCMPFNPFNPVLSVFFVRLLNRIVRLFTKRRMTDRVACRATLLAVGRAVATLTVEAITPCYRLPR